MKRLILAGLASMFLASSANAAVNLTSVTVNGVTPGGVNSGTVWNTTTDSYYAVFVVPTGNPVLNPNDGSISTPLTVGSNIFDIKGEHFAFEDLYKITAVLSNGVTLTELYNRATDTVFSSSVAISGGYKYSLDGFYWENGHNDVVSAFKYVPTGDKTKQDFAGQFTLIQSAVPEPASWAMMLAGFTMMGAAVRGRRRQSKSPATA